VTTATIDTTVRIVAIGVTVAIVVLSVEALASDLSLAIIGVVFRDAAGFSYPHAFPLRAHLDLAELNGATITSIVPRRARDGNLDRLVTICLLTFILEFGPPRLLVDAGQLEEFVTVLEQ